MGSFPCFSVVDGNTGQTSILISDAQKDLGLGPTLMLMTIRSLGFLFMILALINLPLYMMYGNGITPASNLGFSPPEWFSTFSLGNIGESSASCESQNFISKSFKPTVLYCPDGELMTLQLVGFPKNITLSSKQVCQLINNDEKNMLDYMHPECNLGKNFIKPNELTKLNRTWEETCVGKLNCEIPFSIIENSISDECKKILE